MSIFLPQFDGSQQHYDTTESYEWNYENAPALPETFVFQPADRSWKLCGVDVNSPVTIAAGPLLNGRWVLHYAAMGFDVLTYKTVRSKAWPCYPLPNLCPIDPSSFYPGTAQPGAAQPGAATKPAAAQVTQQMHGSWAVSFGMPSTSPDLWRFDVEETRRLLPRQKKLSVSVVASPESDWTSEQVAEDYAQCAYWAQESGADFVELNFSCPNVSNQCGQLFQDFEQSKIVLQRVRERVTDVPILVKIGHVSDRKLIEQTVASMASADALVMINCISNRVEKDGKRLFDGAERGIAGRVIRSSVVKQVETFCEVIQTTDANLEVVAVGGICTSQDVNDCLSCGASGVQLATSAMTGH